MLQYNDRAYEPALEPIPFPHVDMAELHNAKKITCPVYDPKLCSTTKQQVLVYNSSLETRSAFIIGRRLQDAMVNKGQIGGQVVHARILVPCREHMFNEQYENDHSEGSHAEWQVTDREVAIKELFLDKISQCEQQMNSVKAEIKAIRFLQRISRIRKQENLPPLQHISIPLNILTGRDQSNKNRSCLWIVMRYHGTSCDLHDHIVRKFGQASHFSECETKRLFFQILMALQELQSLGISHGDLSAENFVVDHHSKTIKVIDFSTNVRVPEERSEDNVVRRRLIRYSGNRVGKIMYIAPEMLSGHSYDGFAIDLWSCGILLFCMVAGEFPFELAIQGNERFDAFTSDNSLVFEQALVHYNMQQMSPCLQNLLKRMLAKNPLKRPTLHQVLNHEWFLPENDIEERSEKCILF